MRTSNGIAAGIALGITAMLAWWLLTREPAGTGEGAPPPPASPDAPAAPAARTGTSPGSDAAPAARSGSAPGSDAAPAATPVPPPGAPSASPGGAAAPGMKAAPPGGEKSLPGDLGGRILARGGNDLPPGVRVQVQVNELVPAGAGAWRAGKWVGVTVAGEDGRFRLAGLPPGKYRLFVTPGSATFRKIQKDVEVPEGGFRDDVQVELEPCVTGKVRIVARGPGGKPVEGAMLLLVAGSFTSSLHAKSPEPGIYEAEVEAGTVSIDLTEKSAGAASITVTVEEGKTVEAEALLRKRGG